MELVDWADAVFAMDADALATVQAIWGEINTHKLGLHLPCPDVHDPVGHVGPRHRRLVKRRGKDDPVCEPRRTLPGVP